MLVDWNHIFSICCTSILELILHQNVLGIMVFGVFTCFGVFWGFVLFWEGVVREELVFLWSYAPEKETESAQITTSYQHIISICSYWKGYKGSVCNAIPTRINTSFKSQLHKKILPYNTLGYLTGVASCWKGTVLSLSVNSNLLKCATNLYSNCTEWGISLRVTFTTQLRWHQEIQIVPEYTPT